MTGPGTEFSFPFSLDEDGRWRLDDQESSWLFVEWFVVKKNGMIFSKDVRQLLLVVHSSVRIYHFFDRFIYSDPPDCLDSAVHYVAKLQNEVCLELKYSCCFSEEPLFCDVLIHSAAVCLSRRGSE